MIDFLEVRKKTLELCSPLSNEEFLVQSSPEVSPIKWHLGHTSWFFEQFVLINCVKDYRPYKKEFLSYFNTSYKQFGPHWSQQYLSLITNPSLKEVIYYREIINEKIINLLEICDKETKKAIEFCLDHELKQQEKILIHIKKNLSLNLLESKYKKEETNLERFKSFEKKEVHIKGGVLEFGMNPDENYCTLSETPKHKQYINDFFIENALVTNGEYLEFIKSGQYNKHTFWSSNGWEFINKMKMQHPYYWRKIDGIWHEYTLFGLRELDLNSPVMHINHYEACAYASFRGKRLPTEFEWELVSKNFSLKEGNFLEDWNYGPIENKFGFSNIHGNLWEWTSSNYAPYPGQKIPNTKDLEHEYKYYNSGFVLRGGSFATPRIHYRLTYRNHASPESSLNFCGIRLARDIGGN